MLLLGSGCRAQQQARGVQTHLLLHFRLPLQGCCEEGVGMCGCWMENMGEETDAGNAGDALVKCEVRRAEPQTAATKPRRVTTACPPDTNMLIT